MSRPAGLAPLLALAAAVLVINVAVGGGWGPSSSAPPDQARFAGARQRSGGSTARMRTLPSTAVRRGGVLEQTFRWSSSRYSDPWEQVRLTMRLTSPTGRTFQVGGFYHDANHWMARFVPSEVGHWSWRAQISDGSRTAPYQGTFRVTAGGGPGFVRASPYNRFRWTFTSGVPYYPVGIGECLLSLSRSSSPLGNWGLDGGFRPAGTHTNGRLVGMDTYLRAYAQAGVNLFRWSVGNCSFPLYQTIDPGGNVYLQSGGILGDQLVQHLRRHGLRVYMTIFNQPPFGADPTPEQIAAIERYVKYVVDRWGAYVDFWELMNEFNAGEGWYQQVGSYLERIDPYHHPVSTSWERPDLPVINISSPHWYENESEFVSDSDTWQRMAAWKQSGKPVIVGEQGNLGHNWDPTSAVRMRLRAWTAFFAEGTLIFFNSSFAKDNVASSIYLGPQERRYLRVLQSFTSGFDSRASIAHVSVSQPAAVRGYALRGPRAYAAYLVAYTDHSRPTRGVSVVVDPRAGGRATWIDPATGAVLGRVRVRTGTQRLRVPPFTTDVVLKIGR